MTHSLRALAAAALVLAAAAAHAQVRITEVAPWSSGNSPVGADWFELTNTGTSAVSITGWKVDDSSNSAAAAVALNGITSIAPGQSVIFIEGSSATLATTFINTWFGGTAPAGLQIGVYSGSGIGLSTGGDAVNIFDAANNLVTRVDFGTSPTAAPYATFDNAGGLTGTVTLSQLSVAGVNGAFVAANGGEIGSPGRVSAVPEPASVALLLAGLAAVGAAARRQRKGA